MGKSYAASTVERYESLRRRGLNCQDGDGICIRKARWVHVVGTTRDGRQPGDDVISELRLCDYHKEQSDKVIAFYGYAYRNAQLIEVRALNA